MTAVQPCLSVGADICSPDVGKTYAHRPEQNRHAQTPEAKAEQDACARVGRRRLGTLGRSGESRGRQLERVHAPSSVRASSRSARRGEGQQVSALEVSTLDNLAAVAASSPPGGTCWVPAAALAELVTGYRALTALSDLLGKLRAPPEALASGTDNSFGGTTRPEAPSSADPADTATQVKTDSSLVSLSGLPHVAAGPRWVDTREGHRLTQAECSTAATAVRLGSLFIVLEDQSQWGFEGGGFMCLDGEPSEKTRAVMMRWAMQIAELRKSWCAASSTDSVECPRCQVRYSPPDADCPGCAEIRLRGIRSGH